MKLLRRCTSVVVLQVLLVLLPASSQVAALDEDVLQHIEHTAQQPLQTTSEVAISQSQVSEALTQLGRIRKPKVYIPRKPKTLTDKTLYYGNELFRLLFLNGPTATPLTVSSSSAKPKLPQALQKAVDLLEDAAQQDDPDALFLLAEMNMFGNYTHPRNYTYAFQRYQDLAQLNGNASAQHMLGFFYSTGLGGVVEPDQAKAMLYYNFAADNGDLRSEMAVAYRHYAGISTPVSCEGAVRYYQTVADKAIHHIRSGPPGGHATIKEAYRIADAEGGVYGEGASVYSAGIYAKRGGPTSDTFASVDDVMEYLDFLSRKGDLKARFSIAKFMYDGHRSMKRDLQAAKKQFIDIARLYWTNSGKIRTDATPTAEKVATRAAGYLGRMFVRGEGVRQSFEIAQTWLKRGIANGDPLSQYYMGLLYLHGLGVPKDPVRAADFFAPAADQDLAAAQVRLGIMFLDQGDHASAVRYFDLAARSKHTEALYYLAEMTYQGIGRDKSCAHAATLYKHASEKAESIVAPIHEANTAWDEGDVETALVAYMLAAEQGFETAQNNVAYILDQAQPRRYSVTSLPTLIGSFISKRTSSATGAFADTSLALVSWARSAAQDNVDAMVKLGDYYQNGIGVTSLDNERSASLYTRAANGIPGIAPPSAQAQWNLGWMHENGVGLQQDFHLAKRYYDQALETNGEADFAVRLALGKLRLRSWWNKITRGKVKSIQDDRDEKRKYSSLAEWVAAFIEADAEAYEAELAADAAEAARTADTPDLEDWDQSAANGEGGGANGANPGIGDEYLTDIIDDGLLETLAFVALAFTLALLVYYRQAHVQRRQTEERRRVAAERERERAGQGQGVDVVGAGTDAGAGAGNAGAGPGHDRDVDVARNEGGGGGVFPDRADPEFLNWAAGGVGH